jgi:hypothetical protein
VTAFKRLFWPPLPLDEEGVLLDVTPASANIVVKNETGGGSSSLSLFKGLGGTSRTGGSLSGGLRGAVMLVDEGEDWRCSWERCNRELLPNENAPVGIDWSKGTSPMAGMELSVIDCSGSPSIVSRFQTLIHPSRP